MNTDLIGHVVPELDKDNNRFYAGLKARKENLQNLGVFEENVPGTNLSIVKFGLYKVQDYHAEIGRFEDPTQQPMFFDRSELSDAVIVWANEPSNVVPGKIDTDQDIFDFYVEIVTAVCKPGDDHKNYGETSFADVRNILTLYERINGLGRYVAQAKLEQKPARLYMEREELRVDLVRPEREDEMYVHIRNVFKENEFGDEKLADWFTETLISKTLDVEVEYIEMVRDLEDQKNDIPEGMRHAPWTGFTHINSPNQTNQNGWGSVLKPQ